MARAAAATEAAATAVARAAVEMEGDLVVEDLLQNMQHMLEWQSFHSMSNNLVAVEVGVGVGVGDWVRVWVCSTSPGARI